MVIDKLKQGAVITVDSLKEMETLMKYIENESDIKWKAGEKPTEWSPSEFSFYSDSAVSITKRYGENILQYSSLKYFDETVKYIGLARYSCKNLFMSVRRF